MYRHVVAALLSIMVAACTSDFVIIDAPIADQSFSAGDLGYASRRGEILTQIVGNPFAMPPAAFHDRALKAINDAYRGIGPPAEFVTTKSEKVDDNYKTVLIFNPAPRLAAWQLCDGKPPFPLRPSTEPLYVMAAFCSGDVLLTEAEGRVASVQSPDDPRFDKLMTGVVSALFWDSGERDANGPFHILRWLRSLGGA